MTTCRKSPFTLNVDVNAATTLTLVINLGLPLILGAIRLVYQEIYYKQLIGAISLVTLLSVNGPKFDCSWWKMNS